MRDEAGSDVSADLPTAEASEPEGPLDGIPELDNLEIGALRQTLGIARSQLATERVNYFLIARVGGIPDEHPGTKLNQLKLLRAQIALVEQMLVAGGMPDDPSMTDLSIATPADIHELTSAHASP